MKKMVLLSLSMMLFAGLMWYNMEQTHLDDAISSTIGEIKAEAALSSCSGGDFETGIPWFASEQCVNYCTSVITDMYSSIPIGSGTVFVPNCTGTCGYCAVH